MTKPELFRTSFTEPGISKPWHEKKCDLTDYFNYGFNEHTLQIYSHKITKMAEKYSSLRKEYIEKCEQPKVEWQNCFLNALSLKKQMREFNPIDLGGVFIPVDDALLKVKFPT